MTIADDNGSVPLVGDGLTGNYVYADVDDDSEGTSTYRWLRNGVAIGGATATTYVLVADDGDQTITFEVTPVAASGITTGVEITSDGLTVESYQPPLLSLSDVLPLYPSNGADWNDYVRASDTSTPCDGSENGGYSSCIHGGEQRVVEITGTDSCAGIIATDALDAFEWTCEDSTTPIKMVSSGLKEDKNLSDLIDFTATPQWKSNLVTVTRSGIPYTTSSSQWWTNPIVIDNDGMTAGDAVSSTIYVITQTPNVDYLIDASKTALLVQPGVTLMGSSALDTTVVTVDGQNFIWLEGNIDADGSDRGVYWNNVGFSVIRNLQASNANNGSLTRGLHVSASSNNLFTNITASGNGLFGVRLDSASDNNVLTKIFAHNNAMCGIYARSSSNISLSNSRADSNLCGIYFYEMTSSRVSQVATGNNFYGFYLAGSSSINVDHVMSSNNDNSGVHLDAASNNYLQNITVTNTGSAAGDGNGVAVTGETGLANNNVFSNVTVANSSSSGFYLYLADNNIVSNVSAVNNGSGPSNFGGFILYYANNNILSNIAAYQGNYGVSFFYAEDNYFTGLLNTGGVIDAADCFVYMSTTPGLNDVCDNTGTSDASYSSAVSLAGSFIGKITEDDSLNGTQVTNNDGSAIFANITDWTSFSNGYRGWGMDGSSYPAADHQGRCLSGDCRIWDWSILATDTAVRNVLTAHTSGEAANAITHIWSTELTPVDQNDCDAAVPGSIFNTDHCENTFLRNAVEPQNSTGNNNGLCESNEACLHTQNISSDQGSGNLISAGDFIDGAALNGITLQKYGINGTSATLSRSVQTLGRKTSITRNVTIQANIPEALPTSLRME